MDISFDAVGPPETEYRPIDNSSAEIERKSEQDLINDLHNNFNNGHVYYNASNVLLALNPNAEIIDRDAENGNYPDNLTPHLFNKTREILKRISEDGSKSESIIFSGESGSGKSYNAQKSLVYFAEKAGGSVGVKQINALNRLIKSFGCAKTVKNPTSTRFGYSCSLLLKKSKISGLNIRQTLPLEVIRVVAQKPSESNFHVFNELLAGLQPEKREHFGVREPHKFFYLNQGKPSEADSENTKQHFSELDDSLSILGFSEDQKDYIYRILVAILHIGNVYYTQKRKASGELDKLELGSESELKWTAFLLEIDIKTLISSFLQKTIKTDEGVVTVLPYTLNQALDYRDSFAMVLYEELFNWMLNKVSQNFKCSDATATITIYDAYGFQKYNNNGFEELIINSANEKLENAYVKSIFHDELMEYLNEGIHVDYKVPSSIENGKAVELLFRKPYGILPLLDDECKFPRASDDTYFQRCNLNHLDKSCYVKAKNKEKTEFSVRHYAGSTWYSIHEFLRKNKRIVTNEGLRVLATSYNPVLKMIFYNIAAIRDSRDHIVYTAGHLVVAAMELAEKVETSDSIQWIRCIRTNNERAANKWDAVTVQRQLKAMSIPELMAFRKLGYAVRFNTEKFVQQYRCLLPSDIASHQKQREIVADILDSQGIKYAKDYKIGSSKIFLREELYEKLEASRSKIRKNSAVIIQRSLKGYTVRKQYLRRRNAIIRLQAGLRGWKARKEAESLRDQLYGIADKEAQKNKRLAIYRQFLNENNKMNNNENDLPTTIVDHLKIDDNIKQRMTENGAIPHHEVETTITYLPLHSQIPQLNIRPMSLEDFATRHFKNHLLECRQEPIVTPFLNKNDETDFKLAVEIFKLILKYMNDRSMEKTKLDQLAQFIVKQGIANSRQRDEIYAQISNQLHRNSDKEAVQRGWHLMLCCISAFPPSDEILPMLVALIEKQPLPLRNQFNHTMASRFRIFEPQTTRLNPPHSLEMSAMQLHHRMCVEVQMPDGEQLAVEANPWTTTNQLATTMLRHKGIANTYGWTVEIEADKHIIAPTSTHFFHDALTETELGVTDHRSNFFNFPAEKYVRSVSPKKEQNGNSDRQPRESVYSPISKKPLVSTPRVPTPKSPMLRRTVEHVSESESGSEMTESENGISAEPKRILATNGDQPDYAYTLPRKETTPAPTRSSRSTSRHSNYPLNDANQQQIRTPEMRSRSSPAHNQQFPYREDERDVVRGKAENLRQTPSPYKPMPQTLNQYARPQQHPQRYKEIYERISTPSSQRIVYETPNSMQNGQSLQSNGYHTPQIAQPQQNSISQNGYQQPIVQYVPVYMHPHQPNFSQFTTTYAPINPYGQMTFAPTQMSTHLAAPMIQPNGIPMMPQSMVQPMQPMMQQPMTYHQSQPLFSYAPTNGVSVPPSYPPPAIPTIPNQNGFTNRVQMNGDSVDSSQPRIRHLSERTPKSPDGQYTPKHFDTFRSLEQSETRGISVPPSEYSTMSVASRIRRMPVPEQGADVDRFLDEVFQQALPPDEYNRSGDMTTQQIASSIKGGVRGGEPYEYEQVRYRAPPRHPSPREVPRDLNIYFNNYETERAPRGRSLLRFPVRESPVMKSPSPRGASSRNYEYHRRYSDGSTESSSEEDHHLHSSIRRSSPPRPHQPPSPYRSLPTGFRSLSPRRTPPLPINDGYMSFVSQNNYQNPNYLPPRPSPRPREYRSFDNRPPFSPTNGNYYGGGGSERRPSPSSYNKLDDRRKSPIIIRRNYSPDHDSLKSREPPFRSPDAFSQRSSSFPRSYTNNYQPNYAPPPIDNYTFRPDVRSQSPSRMAGYSPSPRIGGTGPLPYGEVIGRRSDRPIVTQYSPREQPMPAVRRQTLGQQSALNVGGYQEKGLNRYPVEQYVEPAVKGSITNGEHLNPNKFHLEREKQAAKHDREVHRDALSKLRDNLKKSTPAVDEVRVHPWKKLFQPKQPEPVKLEPQPMPIPQPQPRPIEQPEIKWVYEGDVTRESTPKQQPVPAFRPPPKEKPKPAVKYTKPPWKLTIRKEMFHPSEQLDDPQAVNKIFAQIISDCTKSIPYRIREHEKNEINRILGSYGVDPIKLNPQYQHQIPPNVKMAVVQEARTWPLYFTQIYEVNEILEEESPAMVAKLLCLHETGIRLVIHEPHVQEAPLRVTDFLEWRDIKNNVAVEEGRSIVSIETKATNQTIRLQSDMAPQIMKAINDSLNITIPERKTVIAQRDYVTNDANLLSFRKGDHIDLVEPEPGKIGPVGWKYGKVGNKYGFFSMQYVSEPEPFLEVDPLGHSTTLASTTLHENEFDRRDDAVRLPDEEFDPTATYTMLEFALKHFRPPSKRDADITWEMSQKIKFSERPITNSLILFEDPNLEKKSVEAFKYIMKYMGDESLHKKESFTDCVVYLIVACIKKPHLTDEIYCQLIKQTTNNTSKKKDSLILGWRLLFIFTAYYAPSNKLLPYLKKYLRETADDERRMPHGTAAKCIENLNQTLKYGGRKCLLTAKEIQSITHNHTVKNQDYYLREGMPKWIHTKLITVAAEIIKEICDELNIQSETERNEFSLCYVTNPNKRDESFNYMKPNEYVLDVCTEMEHRKKEVKFFLRKTVWIHPLRFDNLAYIDMLFEQVHSDYIRGSYISTMDGGQLSAEMSENVSKLGALTHLANHGPKAKLRLHSKNIHELIPASVCDSNSREIERWVEKINEQLQMRTPPPKETEAKMEFLEIVTKLPHFGVTNYKLRSAQEDDRELQDVLLAVSRSGWELLTPRSFQSLRKWSYDEILSIKAVKEKNDRFEDKFVKAKIGSVANNHLYSFKTDDAFNIEHITLQYIKVREEAQEPR